MQFAVSESFKREKKSKMLFSKFLSAFLQLNAANGKMFLLKPKKKLKKTDCVKLLTTFCGHYYMSKK